MLKTLQKVLDTRLWVAHIDDERSDGNSIIVTLESDYVFADNPDCGVAGYDTVKEVEIATRWDNIKRNIDKATGNLEGVSYEEIRYEGYGIAGAAVIVDTMTDNKVRTVAEIRHAFSKHGGNLGTEGSVSFQFRHCGQLIYAPGTSEDQVMEVALEAGADDVLSGEDGSVEVITTPGDFEAVRDALQSAGLNAELAEVTLRPENTVAFEGDDAARMQKLLDALEDLDDVQEVYHNAAL